MSKGITRVSPPAEAERRSFLARMAAILIGGVVALFPFAAGLGVLFDPVRRRRARNAAATRDTAGFTRICLLEALPADGVPRQFAVVADARDAWMGITAQRIGSIYLSRNGGENENEQVRAFTAACPHLGCSIEYSLANERFECPCHESAFARQGEKMFGPSLRGLDSLEIKLVGENGAKEVWVAFERFLAGIEERIPVG
jgi:menaquinol-cytochrome c reductase iron-sulfur subunit